MRASRPSIDLTFYETYHFAHVVKEVLEDQFEYIRRLHDFYGDGSILHHITPFPRFSALHAFIEFVLADLISEEAELVDLDDRKAYITRFGGIAGALEPHPARLPIELAMERFRVQHESFEKWLSTSRDGRAFQDADEGDVHDYYDELRLGGEFEELLGKASREVFFVLFQNRRVLLLFNDMMAEAVRDETGSDDPRAARHFERPGVLKRVNVPQWARRAVFFRDRGRCVLCDCDLSGLVSPWSEENYDHMVPLAAGGLNDCTNLQLLCAACNAKKAAGEPVTSSRYEAWFDDVADD
jgi:hypothetical protein